MSAKDIYHDRVRKALENDGWTITHDPLSVKWLGRTLQVDLGAERLIAAEKGTEKIAVEVKSFLGDSPIEDLRDALGQFMIYRSALSLSHPQRKLYLAIREDVYANLFEKPEGEILRIKEQIRLIVFDAVQEEIIVWIS
jgi:XisH protein